ncbi:MAG: TldD/PmbA family protein [bacterium]|nr:TldD/PmbA family protein [bacterium]
MKEKIEKALEAAMGLGASYADIRFTSRKKESLSVKNGRPEAISNTEDNGIGVRVIAEGSWGFSSSSDISDLNKVVKNAIDIARSSGLTKKEDVCLDEAKPIIANHITPCKIDPFSVPLEEKLNLLLQADSLMNINPKIKIREAGLMSFLEDKIFASTEGSYIDQKRIETGGEIAATAIEGSEVQRRSYPNNFGDYQSRGFEFVKEMDFEKNAERIAEEALCLLSAPKAPAGEQTIIVDGGQLTLQVHESIGHPIELDRVLGTESAYAGDSFLKPEMLGVFRYGSNLINITADATLEGGLGSFAFDDEGIPGQKVDIIKDGVFCGFLTSRETARVLGQKSNGTMRADGWGRIPLIRMTNINLLPGEWALEDLIADTEDGIYLATNKCWSIDNKRLNFQFGCEFARKIRNGRLAEVMKNPVYTGITGEFWKSCDAVCNKNHWHIFGVPNCGKGQPGQSAHVGHGVAPARFRRVRML